MISNKVCAANITLRVSFPLATIALHPLTLDSVEFIVSDARSVLRTPPYWRPRCFRFLKTQDLNFKAGDVQYSAATTHLPENTGDQAFNVIVIELKGKPAKSAKATTK